MDDVKVTDGLDNGSDVTDSFETNIEDKTYEVSLDGYSKSDLNDIATELDDLFGSLENDASESIEQEEKSAHQDIEFPEMDNNELQCEKGGLSLNGYSESRLEEISDKLEAVFGEADYNENLDRIGELQEKIDIDNSKLGWSREILEREDGSKYIIDSKINANGDLEYHEYNITADEKQHSHVHGIIKQFQDKSEGLKYLGGHKFETKKWNW